MQKFNNRIVLVSMLDWGLGHTTRCIPIVKALQNNELRIFIACNSLQKKILENELSNIEYFHLTGYNVVYSKKKWLFNVYILLQTPLIFYKIIKEKKWLNSFLQQYSIDYIASDNRYGFFSKKVPSVFITHQLTIQTPFGWLTKFVQRINYFFINQFTCCWVPDVENSMGLAGILSHPIKKPLTPVVYIGLLSRLQHMLTSTEIKYKFCAIVSGPEPQRSILEEQLLQVFSTIQQPTLLINSSIAFAKARYLSPNTTCIPLANNYQLQEYIANSEYIICRSGYTTLMELLPLQQKLIVIATPGQTEQEYLANYIYTQHWCISIQQQQLNANALIKSIENFTYTEFKHRQQAELATAIKNLLKC